MDAVHSGGRKHARGGDPTRKDGTYIYLDLPRIPGQEWRPSLTHDSFLSPQVGLAANFVQAVGFWTLVNVITDCLLVAAFVLRVIGIRTESDVRLATSVLSFASFAVD